MITHALVRALVQSSEDGLTFHEIVEDIPTDPASLFATVLLVGSVSLVLWAGRPKKNGGIGDDTATGGETR